MSTTHPGDPDDGLFEELRAAMQASSTVPPSYAEAARTAFAWRSIDAELALLALSDDSSVSEPAPVRGTDTGSPRILIFSGAELAVQLEILPHLITGQLIPPRAGQVSLETAQGAVSRAEVDDDGFFVLPRPATGPARLALAGPRASVTDWVKF